MYEFKPKKILKNCKRILKFYKKISGNNKIIKIAYSFKKVVKIYPFILKQLDLLDLAASVWHFPDSNYRESSLV